MLQVRRRARLLAREQTKEEEAEEIRRSLEGNEEPAAEEVPV